MQLAMANKYYDGIIFRIPQLTMAGSFMGERATAKGVGIALDPAQPDYADRLFDYFQTLDREAFDRACDADLTVILAEFHRGQRVLREIFNS